MALLTLICGLPGSGKSTLAGRLAAETGALWISADAWIDRAADARSEQDQIRDALEGIIVDHSMELLARGIDVILDFGFWSRAERAALAARAERAGARFRLIFCEAPIDELVNRVLARNPLAGDHLQISEDELRRWEDFWEPPTPEERSMSV
jgi:predicted kinase